MSAAHTDHHLLPHLTSGPTSTLELSLSCLKLKDKDVMSKSDPMCVLFEKVQGQWVELGRTERVINNLSPTWQTRLIVNYRFEERQILKFEVYDIDAKSTKLGAHDFLARVECSLGSLVSAPGKRFVSEIKEGPSKGGGQLIVTTEELSSNREVVNMHLAARNLDKKDTFGKSDPYYIISRAASTGGVQFSPVYKSKVIKNTLSPSWEPATISVRELCNGDYGRALRVEVFDWDQKGEHELIGTFDTSLRGLTEAIAQSTVFECINAKKQKSKKNYRNSGEVFLKHFFIESHPSFVDYIQGGTDLNFSVAVDFTASNGNPSDSRSLHHRSSSGENQYTTAIRAVGEIVQDYDADKHFPALGFGAKVPPNDQLSHEFFLNLRQDNPYCAGVDGLLQAYFTALQHVKLCGPTNFAPVINHVARFAATYQDGRQYFILLIITDGVITDMEETKAAVAAASSLPMSIIIVGVGAEDFHDMEALDGDKTPLKGAIRDIVQFVELRRFVDKDGRYSKERLAKEVLAEVPGQVIGWMNKRGIKPLRA